MTGLPGPPQLLPRRPEVVVDLQTEAGASLVGATWSTRPARVVDAELASVGPDLGPSGPPAATQDLAPRLEDLDDDGWAPLAPADTLRRLADGLLCFRWYRLRLELPEALGDLVVRGTTVVLEVVVDDYAELRVRGGQAPGLGDSGGAVVAGFNAPNRLHLTRCAEPGRSWVVDILGINGPLAAPPANFVWVRSAVLEVHRVDEEPSSMVEDPDHLLDGRRLRRVATGFTATAGPVVDDDGAVRLAGPDVGVVYRWSADTGVSVAMSKAGHAGLDHGRWSHPGAHGLAVDPEGRLLLCQHGHRRLLRVERRGDHTVLLDRWSGRRLNAPHAVAVGAGGTAYVCDPAFPLPRGADDADRELATTGVYGVRDGSAFLVDDELAEPSTVAVSADGRHLWATADAGAGGADLVRWPLGDDGRAGAGEVLATLPGRRAGSLAVDGGGRLWVAQDEVVTVLDAAGGDVLGRLVLTEPVTGMAWHDETLIVTTPSSLHRTTDPDTDPDPDPKEIP